MYNSTRKCKCIFAREEKVMTYNIKDDPAYERLQTQIAADYPVEGERGGEVEGGVSGRSTSLEEARAVFGRRDRKYPWAKWFVDGKMLTLTHGVHFQTHPETFRVTLYNTAKRRGWEHVITSVNGPTVSFIVTQNDELARTLREGTAKDVATPTGEGGRWVEA